MPNTIVTEKGLTRKALMILHQKLNFIGNIYREYDKKFAVDGAKIGSTLDIRLPNEYPTGTGPTITTADTTENVTQLSVSQQRWVAPDFLASELTLSMDEFSDRVLEPAMARLASIMEADALTMSRDVYWQVGTPGTTPNTLLTYLLAMARVTDSLGPLSKRCYHIKPLDMATIVDALKGLFQDSSAIAEQYREGIMGRSAGGDWYQNTLMDRVTNGSNVTGVGVSGAGQTGSSLLIGASVVAGNTFRKGQVFTIAGVNEVHPETKIDRGTLQQFVVTADTTAAGVTVSIPISPAIIATGPTQNVTAAPANLAALTFAGASLATYGLNLHYNKNAFALATADLLLPKGVDMGARDVMEGISMRVIRQYKVDTDKLTSRIDVLYGYKTTRPQLAARIASS